MSEFRLVPRAELPARWEGLRPVLQRAVAQGRGELEVDDIYALTLQGRMCVFATDDDSFAITAEIMNYPRKRVFLLGFGAGTTPEVGVLHGVLSAAAKGVGAQVIQTYCSNHAMVRYYTRHKFDPVYTVLERGL